MQFADQQQLQTLVADLPSWIVLVTQVKHSSCITHCFLVGYITIAVQIILLLLNQPSCFFMLLPVMWFWSHSLLLYGTTTLMLKDSCATHCLPVDCRL